MHIITKTHSHSVIPARSDTIFPIPAAAIVDRHSTTPILSSIRSACDVMMTSSDVVMVIQLTYHCDHDEVVKETKPNKGQHVLVAH